AQGCAAFSAEAACLLGKSRRLRGPGAKPRARRPGCAFFAPGFFAQAKKGGSRRHGAKALELAVAVAIAKQRKIKDSSLRSPLIRPPGTFSRKREKGCLTDLPQAEEGLFDRCSAGGREVDPIFRKQRRRVG